MALQMPIFFSPFLVSAKHRGKKNQNKTHKKSQNQDNPSAQKKETKKSDLSNKLDLNKE